MAAPGSQVSAPQAGRHERKQECIHLRKAAVATDHERQHLKDIGEPDTMMSLLTVAEAI